MPNLRWELPTTKMRFNLGDRGLDEGNTYTQWTCEQTGVDETTGEPILTRIVSRLLNPLSKYTIPLRIVLPKLQPIMPTTRVQSLL